MHLNEDRLMELEKCLDVILTKRILIALVDCIILSNNLINLKYKKDLNFNDKLVCIIIKNN